ncbi:GlxA family transcriptional regulator [Archangium violaceum]|uniref:GlxA family transcriptional regulator n=1 Tax=Archangium violaceum TaxID=83451 RepID=UPI001EF01778|nr:GlxA family transcriptional regulator [Archangium violaceum]
MSTRAAQLVRSGRKNGSVRQARRVVVLAVPPVQELDVVGPVEVFAGLNRLLGRSGSGYEIELVTSTAERLVTGESGLSLLAGQSFHEVRGRIDTLLVAGGTGVLNVRDPSLLRWLCERASQVRRLGSICTGAFLLAEAGLLDGRRATTHWGWAREMALRYPRVSVDPNPIWIQDGRIYTSAGVTTGMDLALGLVEEDFGSTAALQVARGLVLFLRRSGGQAQFSVALSAQSAERKALHELQVWMAENPGERMSVESLAARVAMSPRNFARVFLQELGKTPARYVQQLRVEAARRLLERTDKGVEEIANSCGFGSAEVMRRAFLRGLGVTPARYREHFQGKSNDS